MDGHTNISLSPHGCFGRIVYYMKVELNQVPLGNRSSFKVSRLTSNLKFPHKEYLENSITKLSAVLTYIIK
jgi:hypothetical protein